MDLSGIPWNYQVAIITVLGWHKLRDGHPLTVFWLVTILKIRFYGNYRKMTCRVNTTCSLKNR